MNGTLNLQKPSMMIFSYYLMNYSNASSKVGWWNEEEVHDSRGYKSTKKLRWDSSHWYTLEGN